MQMREMKCVQVCLHILCDREQHFDRVNIFLLHFLGSAEKRELSETLHECLLLSVQLRETGESNGKAVTVEAQSDETRVVHVLQQHTETRGWRANRGDGEQTQEGSENKA